MGAPMPGADQNSIMKGTGDEGQGRVPATLMKPGAVRFWLAVVVTGIGAGASAAALTLLLSEVQHLAWPSASGQLLDAATEASAWRHVFVLLGAGLLTGVAQVVFVKLSAAVAGRRVEGLNKRGLGGSGRSQSCLYGKPLRAIAILPKAGAAGS